MTEATILIGLFLALAGAMVLLIIPWRRLAVQWTGNNIGKATIYVRRDDEVFPRPGRLSHEADDGTWYVYRWLNTKLEVLVPPGYPTVFVAGHRMIGVKSGATTATDLPMCEPGRDCSAVDIGAVVQGRIMTELVKQVSGGAMPSWIIPAVCVVVAIGIMYYVTQVNPELLSGLLGNAGGVQSPGGLPGGGA